MKTQSLSDREFHLIVELVYNILGIRLTDAKRTLVSSRFHRVLLDLGFNNFGDYYDYIISDATGKALIKMVDKITTNFSYFFRESEHFKFMVQSSLPDISANLKKTDEIRIWDAGCATGEEAYTISMVLLEHSTLPHQDPHDYSILATDISNRAINIAKKGEYLDGKMTSLPSALRLKYFDILPGSIYSVKRSVRNQILFRRLNLKRDSFPFNGKFDLIFCRNVMIYFDEKSRNDLVVQFARYIKPGGYLFIGHAETLPQHNSFFKHVSASVYRKY